jgi:hypothetical protein
VLLEIDMNGALKTAQVRRAEKAEMCSFFTAVAGYRMRPYTE